MEHSRVLALGFFDGVHIGHGALLRRTRQAADRLGAAACAVSFDAHPMQVVTGRQVPLLSTPVERQLLMQRLYGMDELIVTHFDEAVRNQIWQDFLQDYLIGTLHACHLVCGFDYRFGFRGEGTPEKLAQACRELGVGCDVIGAVHLHGQEVSSTRIRALLTQGDAAAAAELLGHPHLICGRASSGVLAIESGILVPAEGVYDADADSRSCRIEIRNGCVLLPEGHEDGQIRVWLKNKVAE